MTTKFMTVRRQHAMKHGVLFPSCDASFFFSFVNQVHSSTNYRGARSISFAAQTCMSSAMEAEKKYAQFAQKICVRGHHVAFVFSLPLPSVQM
jgi:hypothetical protein